MRLRAVLLAGADLEFGDECGQTAVLIAAWRSRRREFCHSAAPPSPFRECHSAAPPNSLFSRRFNTDGEGRCSRMTEDSPAAQAWRGRPAALQVESRNAIPVGFLCTRHTMTTSRSRPLIHFSSSIPQACSLHHSDHDVLRSRPTDREDPHDDGRFFPDRKPSSTLARSNTWPPMRGRTQTHALSLSTNTMLPRALVSVKMARRVFINYSQSLLLASLMIRQMIRHSDRCTIADQTLNGASF